MDAVIRWIARHQGLSWAGFALGVAQVLAAPQLGWRSAPGLVLLLLGGILIGGLGAGLILAQSRKFSVECLECIQVYELTGVRGSNVRLTMTSLFKARSRLESFVLTKTSSSGPMRHESTAFRNLGLDGRKNASLPSLFSLNKQHLFETDAPGEGTTLMIVPPAPIRKREFFEVERLEIGTDCFPNEDEYVEKRALFPIKELTFKLAFDRDLRVTNGSSIRYEAGVPEGFQTVAPVAQGSGTQLVWKARHVKPGEAVRVSWRWG